MPEKIFMVLIGLWLVYDVVLAIRTGVISVGVNMFDRSDDPVRFYIVVGALLFLAVLNMTFSLWLLR